ncbi:MAG: membrane protein [Dehalococcoidia bacterium]|nr:MAG: membrane protein [Dehalococcoidia bacterium]
MDPFLAVLLSWNADPLAGAGLLLAAFWYVRGCQRLARSGGFHRQLGVGRVAAAFLGWAVLAIALLSPIAVFGGFFLSAHMLQHLLIVQVAAPLLLLGRPVPTVLLGLPRSLGRALAPLLARDGPLYRLGSWLSEPVVSLVVSQAIFLGWHLPPLYDAAIRNGLLHGVEHLTFLGSALLFWWPALDPLSGRNQRRRFMSLISLFVAFMLANVLGIWFVFTDTVVYPSYAVGPRLFGVAPRDDQIAGGLVMWILGGLLYMVGLMGVAAAAMRAEEEATRRREAREAALAP